VHAGGLELQLRQARAQHVHVACSMRTAASGFPIVKIVPFAYAREACQFLGTRLDRLLQRDEAAGRKALDQTLVEDAQLDAGVLAQRVLRVELAERVDLLAAQQGRRRGRGR
jgi:hypothetical protein